MPFRSITLLLTSLIFTVGPVFGRSQTVRISGTSAMAKVIERSADKLKERKTKMDIKLNINDSGTGLKDLANDKADLCLMAREISNEELKAHSQLDFQVTHLAWDAAVPVVSYNIYIKKMKVLTIKELVKIFKKEITDWSEVGGPPGKIEVIEQKESDGVFHSFIMGVFQNEQYEYSPTSKIGVRTLSDIHDLVMESTSAIAALPPAWTSDTVRAIGIKTRKGVLFPIPELVRGNRYPTSFHLSVVTTAPVKAEVKILIDFLLSREGQQIIKEEHMVPMFLHN